MSVVEGPCITDAMKNYLAFRTAAAMIDDPSTSDVPPASPLELQGMARATLAAINRTPLPEGFELPAGQAKATKALGRALLAAPGFFAVVRASVLAEPGKLDVGALAVFVDEFERSFKVRAKAAPARTRLVGISQLPPRTRVVMRPIATFICTT